MTVGRVSQGPKWDFRSPPGHWVAVVATIALVAVVTAVALTGGGGRHVVVPPKVPSWVGGPGAVADGGPGDRAAHL